MPWSLGSHQWPRSGTLLSLMNGGSQGERTILWFLRAAAWDWMCFSKREKGELGGPSV